MSAFSIFRRFKRERRATAAIEFVLIVPIMLAMFAAIVEFGRAWQVYDAVNRLASRYAIAWADCSDLPVGTGACGTELSLYTPTATMQNMAPQLNGGGGISLHMVEVQMFGSTPTTLYSFGGSTLSASELTVAQNTFPDTQIGVVVTVSYTHSLVFFQQLMGPFLTALHANPWIVTYTVAQLKS